jgi:hypothetical protein
VVPPLLLSCKVFPLDDASGGAPLSKGRLPAQIVTAWNGANKAELTRADAVVGECDRTTINPVVMERLGRYDLAWICNETTT